VHSKQEASEGHYTPRQGLPEIIQPPEPCQCLWEVGGGRCTQSLAERWQHMAMGTSFCLSSRPHGSSMVQSPSLFIPTKHNSSPRTPTAASVATQQSTVTDQPISCVAVLDPRSIKSTCLQLVLLSFIWNLLQETGVKVWNIVKMTNKTWIEKKPLNRTAINYHTSSFLQIRQTVRFIGTKVQRYHKLSETEHRT